MIKTSIRLGSFAFILLSGILSTTQAQQASNYSYTEAFSPLFYTNNASVYRSAAGKPGEQYWQNRANYSIKARLDEQKQEITASVQIEYINNSPDAMDYVWLQLDQNLFKKDSRGQLSTPLTPSRYGDAASEFEGGYQIQSVNNEQGQAVTYTIDDTRMQVRLPKALAPKGGRLQLTINYQFRIPPMGADRTGILKSNQGEIFAVAQWFPRMAVYDDVLGWNNLPYTGPGEFYLDYGDYDVEITAPASHLVVMGAALLNPQEVFTDVQYKRYQEAQKSRKTVVIRTAQEVKDASSRPAKKELTWKYALKNSRDIAWASSKAFVLDGAKITLPSGASSLALSAYPGESLGNNAWERSTEYTQASIEHYSARWYEYPYPVAVNVASNVSGMEYPAISFCGNKSKGEGLWGVTDHEFGHNWFPMIVGSNERLHGWMDEGFNSFINEISTQEFNKGEYHRSTGSPNKLTRALFNPKLEPIMSTPQNMQERSIGALVYYKPAYGLKLLREVIIGKERFDAAFRQYIADWAFKHPTPADFFRSIENGTGESLAWFWRGWFMNNWSLDQGIKQVSYVDNDAKKGAIIEVENLQRLPMPLTVEATTLSGTKHRVKLPVEIWERASSWKFKIPTNEELKAVVIDPDQLLPDVNPDNNIWIKQ